MWGSSPPPEAVTIDRHLGLGIFRLQLVDIALDPLDQRLVGGTQI
jgi:hypothetical protein